MTNLWVNVTAVLAVTVWLCLINCMLETNVQITYENIEIIDAAQKGQLNFQEENNHGNWHNFWYMVYEDNLTHQCYPVFNIHIMHVQMFALDHLGGKTILWLLGELLHSKVVRVEGQIRHQRSPGPQGTQTYGSWKQETKGRCQTRTQQWNKGMICIIMLYQVKVPVFV